MVKKEKLANKQWFINGEQTVLMDDDLQLGSQLGELLPSRSCAQWLYLLGRWWQQQEGLGSWAVAVHQHFRDLTLRELFPGGQELMKMLINGEPALWTQTLFQRGHLPKLVQSDVSSRSKSLSRSKPCAGFEVVCLDNTGRLTQDFVIGLAVSGQASPVQEHFFLSTQRISRHSNKALTIKS